jgi:hypothetical protein
MSQPSTTTSSATSSEGQPVVTEEATNSGDNSNTQDFSELPSTLEAALERIKELRSKRDLLLSEKTKSEKEIEKLTKLTRMETLKSLIPRELFARSDTYEAELEKVYSWQGLSDKDISDIYQAKLSSIDSGKRVKQHSSSSTKEEDSRYAHFKTVPQFHSAAATKIQQSMSENERLFNLMKRIAGNSSNNN